MEKRRRVIITLMLMLAIGNFFRVNRNDTIRPIEFLSIFAIGLLAGVLIQNIANAIKQKNNR